MLELDVFEKVQEPTDWVSSLVIVRKRNKIRVCLDHTDLNKSIKREHYPMQTIEEVVSRMPSISQCLMPIEDFGRFLSAMRVLGYAHLILHLEGMPSNAFHLEYVLPQKYFRIKCRRCLMT